MAGSICLLLWGSFTVRNAVEEGFAATLRSLLVKAASSPALATLGGATAALLMQSATATILLCCGFLNSGMMSISAAIGVVLGADLGSAIATRILFLDLSALPSGFLIAGTILHLAAKSWRMKNLGRIAIGLGIMLLAIQWMKQVVGPIAGAGIPADWLSVMHSAPIVAVIVTALATWFAHSSVAIVLVLASLAQIGLIDLSLSVPMLLGANIGAGLIALPMTSRKHTASRAVVLSNIAGRSLLAITFLLTRDWWLQLPVPGTSSPGNAIITFHILFNIALVIFFAPFAGRVATRLKQEMDNRKSDQGDLYSRVAGKGLSVELIEKPSQALSAAKREAFRLGDLTENMLASALNMFDATDRSEISALVDSDKEINARNKAIHAFLSSVRRSVTDQEQEKELDRILHFSSTMENIGDTISYDLARLAGKKMGRNASFSQQGLMEIKQIHEGVLGLLSIVINRFAVGEVGNPKDVNKKVKLIRKLCAESVSSHRRRLSENSSKSISSSSIHQDTVRDFLQVALLLEHQATD